MTTTTPGVYFEQADRGRPAVGPLRTDIAGFVGYTQRGPMLAPVRIASWRQFESVFGTPLEFGYLGDAIRGFFDNGGDVCYVARVADAGRARAATVTLLDLGGQPAVQLTASHGQLIDPGTGQPQTEDGVPVRYDSPGAWGNRLAVEVLPAGAGAAEATPPQPSEADATIVDSLKGFQVGSIVGFVQDGFEAPAYRTVAAITPYLLRVEWDQPLHGLGLDLSRPFRIETREFSLRVLIDGQIVERHDDLSLSPPHRRNVTDVLNRDSQYLDAATLVDVSALGQPAVWPVSTGTLALTGGRDGLSSVGKADFLAALDALALVDEVGVLAAPDLVLRVEQIEALPPPERAPDCENLDPPPAGRIFGEVVTIDDDGAVQPVAGVRVTPLNVGVATVTSGADGRFTLLALPAGHVSLRLERAGFHPLETTARSREGGTEPATFTLAPVTTPPALSLDDIGEVQAAMARQGEAGLYRVALLDAPSDRLKLDEVQTWRTRFDTAFGALYYPWIWIGEEGQSRLVPPSGHIAGLIARTDLGQGVHRAPANYGLAGVRALSHPVDDVEHGILNEQGINVLRAVPARGIRVLGARTLSSDSEWSYLNVRRLVLMIEEALEDANQWVVFEPNNPLLRQLFAHNIRAFLDTLWRQGALAGETPDAAYRVKCDIENNPPSVVDAGRLIADVGVAPAIPFEFIRFRLGRTVEVLSASE